MGTVGTKCCPRRRVTPVGPAPHKDAENPPVDPRVATLTVESLTSVVPPLASSSGAASSHEPASSVAPPFRSSNGAASSQDPFFGGSSTDERDKVLRKNSFDVTSSPRQIGWHHSPRSHSEVASTRLPGSRSCMTNATSVGTSYAASHSSPSSSTRAPRRPKSLAQLQGFWERQEETGLDTLPCEMHITGDKMIRHDGTIEPLTFNGNTILLAGLMLSIGPDNMLDCKASSGALIRYERSATATKDAVVEFQGDWYRMPRGRETDSADFAKQLTIDGICWTYTGRLTRKGCLKQSDDDKSVLLAGCRVIKMPDARLVLVPPSGDILYFGRHLDSAAAIFSQRLGPGPWRSTDGII